MCRKNSYISTYTQYPADLEFKLKDETAECDAKDDGNVDIDEKKTDW